MTRPVYLAHVRDYDGALVQYVRDDRDCLPPDILAGSFQEGSIDEGFETTIQDTIWQCEHAGWRVSFDAYGFVYETEEG